MVANPIRETSTLTYESHWAVYTRWCIQEQCHPIYTNVQNICKYLQFLYGCGLATSTVLGHLSAISTFTVHVTKEKWGSDLTVINLLKHLSRVHRKPKRASPEWDISVVLNGLRRINSRTCAIATLLYKTSFLVALGSGFRRGEVHAMIRQGLKHDLNWSYVVIHIQKSFLAKAQNPLRGNKKALEHIRIPALPRLDDGSANPLCPVFNLRCYVNRTDITRHTAQVRLFIPAVNLLQDIKIDTVSRWIKKGIELGYSLEDQEISVAHYAHQVRSTSGTLAFACGVPLTNVLDAGRWSHSSTFFKNYYYDLPATAQAWLADNSTITMGGRVGGGGSGPQ